MNKFSDMLAAHRDELNKQPYDSHNAALASLLGAWHRIALSIEAREVEAEANKPPENPDGSDALNNADAGR